MMKLTEYLDGMRAATTAAELEAAIQADFKHSFRGRTWTQICTVRIEAGEHICVAHPHGHLVPKFGPRRALSVCGETYKVGKGQNGAGVRYCWHYAGEWAMDLMKKHGLSIRAANQIWDCWAQYPHRALATIEKALAGEIPDPDLNVMIRHDRTGAGGPIRYTIEQNNGADGDRRATRVCACGGTLFDWGCGYSQGFNYINWHCNACPDVFSEYMTQERLYKMRQDARAKLPANH